MNASENKDHVDGNKPAHSRKAQADAVSINHTPDPADGHQDVYLPNSGENNPFVIALQREQKRAEERSYLYQMALDLIARPGARPGITAEIALDSMFALLDCQRGAILLVNEDNGSLEFSATRGKTDWIKPAIYEPFMSAPEARILKDSSNASYVGVSLRAGAEWFGLMIARREPTSLPFTDDEQHLIMLLASVTSTVLLNNQLRQSLTERLELIQAMMESTPTGLAVIENRSRRLLMANPAALRILQLDRRAIEMPLNIDSPDGLLVERMTEALIPEHEPVFDYRLIRNGRDRVLRIEIVPLSSEKLVAQISDVTLLREVNVRWETEVVSASHDLKTPLTIISLGLSALRDYYEETSDAERQAYIEESLEQVEAMKGSVSALIKHATQPQHVLADRDLADECIIDPAFYVEEVAGELLPFARHHGVTLSWNIPPSGDVAVRGNPATIKTIVRNLLTNAIKYTPAHNEVWVNTALSVDRANFSIAIRDNGVGIPNEELGAIFERGYRATTSGDKEGSGLGLSFVRELVDQLQGAIYVESAVYVGSTFQVVLPCVDPPPQ